VLGTDSGPNLLDIFGKLIKAGLSAYLGGGAGSTDLDFSDAHYASGTMSARRGLALVGENGPEYVAMRGGERVYSANQTRGMWAGQGAVTVNNHFAIQGPVNSQTEYQIAQAANRGLARQARR